MILKGFFVLTPHPALDPLFLIPKKANKKKKAEFFWFNSHFQTSVLPLKNEIKIGFSFFFSFFPFCRQRWRNPGGSPGSSWEIEIIFADLSRFLELRGDGEMWILEPLL